MVPTLSKSIFFVYKCSIERFGPENFVLVAAAGRFKHILSCDISIFNNLYFRKKLTKF